MRLKFLRSERTAAIATRRRKLIRYLLACAVLALSMEACGPSDRELAAAQRKIVAARAAVDRRADSVFYAAIAPMTADSLGKVSPVTCNNWASRIAAGPGAKAREAWLASCEKTVNETDCMPNDTSSAAGFKWRPTVPFEPFLESKFAKDHLIHVTGVYRLGSHGGSNRSLFASLATENEYTLGISTRCGYVDHVGFMVLGETMEGKELQFANALVGAIAASMGTVGPKLSSSNFSPSFYQIADAPVRSHGRLRIRTGTVGNDAVLSMDVR